MCFVKKITISKCKEVETIKETATSSKHNRGATTKLDRKITSNQTR